MLSDVKNFPVKTADKNNPVMESRNNSLQTSFCLKYDLYSERKFTKNSTPQARGISYFHIVILSLLMSCTATNTGEIKFIE